MAKLAGRRCISLVALDLKNPHLEIGTHLNIQSKTVNPYNNSFELLVKDLERYKKNGYQRDPAVGIENACEASGGRSDGGGAERLFIRKTTITR